MCVISLIARCPQRSTAQRGMTIIELIVVMVIMSVLVAVAAPRLMQNDSEVRSAAEQLRSTLRYAQRMAVARNRDVCVSVTTSTVIFTVAPSAGTGVACTGGSLTPLGNSGAGETLDMVFPAGTTLSIPAPGSFRFTPTGTLANNAGAVVTITIDNNGVVFATLSIQPDNGFVLASTF